jgi:hypothetical protein
MEQILERARKTVKLPDHDDITVAELVYHPVQLWAIPAATARGFLEGALAPSVLQRAQLERAVLIVTLRDAGIANEHSEPFINVRFCTGQPINQ